MTVKSWQHSGNNQSPLSVLDNLSVDSPETVVKQRSSFSALPPKATQPTNAGCQQLSTDSTSSGEGMRFSLPASRPVLTACPTSPTRPKPHGRIRVRSSLLSRSSSLTDNKVCRKGPSMAQAVHSRFPSTFCALCRFWWPQNCIELPAWLAQTCSPLRTTSSLSA